MAAFALLRRSSCSRSARFYASFPLLVPASSSDLLGAGSLALGSGSRNKSECERSSDDVAWKEKKRAERFGLAECCESLCLCGLKNGSSSFGILRLPGAQEWQQRGFAAKTRKAKSSEVTEEVEDVASSSKECASRMMESALDVLSREHAKLRTGRASSGMLDHITVEAHGVRTPLSHIAAVTVSGLQTLNVLPYDPSMIKEVEKSILSSPLGLNPQIDGQTLVVPLPRLTKEHCETMCKLANKSGEVAKLSIRRARKDALDSLKSSGLSKDELKRVEKDVEEMTKKYVKSIDDLCKRKEKEIMA